MASVEHTNDARHNNVGREKVDARQPHDSSSARTTSNDFGAERSRVSSTRGSSSKWLWGIVAIVAAVILLFFILGAFGSETATTIDDGPVVTEENAPVADDADIVVVPTE